MPGMDVYTVVGAGDMLSEHWSPHISLAPRVSDLALIMFGTDVWSVGFGNRRLYIHTRVVWEVRGL